jgi:Hemerythrin HHE cation binding domain
MAPETRLDEAPADSRDMFVAHTMFRREFRMMPDLVRAVTPGDKQRATLVAEHIALVSRVLSQHYVGEDRHIWPRLRNRCAQECGPLLDVIEDQHHAIHTCLLQVSKALQPWRNSASARARGALAAAIDRLIAVITEHLALEEERVEAGNSTRCSTCPLRRIRWLDWPSAASSSLPNRFHPLAFRAHLPSYGSCTAGIAGHMQ